MRTNPYSDSFWEGLGCLIICISFMAVTVLVGLAIQVIRTGQL